MAAAKTTVNTSQPDTHPAVRVSIYRSDAASTPPGVMHANITIARVDGSSDIIDLQLENGDGTPAVDGTLTVGQLATVKAVATGLYTRALAKGGYV